MPLKLEHKQQINPFPENKYTNISIIIPIHPIKILQTNTRTIEIDRGQVLITTQQTTKKDTPHQPALTITADLNTDIITPCILDNLHIVHIASIYALQKHPTQKQNNKQRHVQKKIKKICTSRLSKQENSREKRNNNINISETTAKWIKENYKTRKPINPDTLKLPISSRTLNRVLTSMTGLSARALLESYKLHMAKHEILNSKYIHIKEIAYEHGFSSHEYFSTRYKSAFGCTPTNTTHHYKHLTHPITINE